MAQAVDSHNVYVDPVTHEAVDPAHYAARYHYNGRNYHFASVESKKMFESDPMLWVSTPHASMNSSNIDIEDYS